MIGLDPTAVEETTARRTMRCSDAAASGPAGDFVGTYTSPYFGKFVVTEKNGTLTGALGTKAGYTFMLDPWNGDTQPFVPTGENALPGSLSSAVFVRKDGQITGVTLTYFIKFPRPGQETNGLGVCCLGRVLSHTAPCPGLVLA